MQCDLNLINSKKQGGMIIMQYKLGNIANISEFAWRLGGIKKP